MKTITTTREYDADGRLVKEVVCEVVTNDAPISVPAAGYCTCGTTSGSCPIHGRPPLGWWQTPVTTCGTTATSAGILS